MYKPPEGEVFLCLNMKETFIPITSVREQYQIPFDRNGKQTQIRMGILRAQTERAKSLNLEPVLAHNLSMIAQSKDRQDRPMTPETTLTESVASFINRLSYETKIGDFSWREITRKRMLTSEEISMLTPSELHEYGRDMMNA